MADEEKLPPLAGGSYVRLPDGTLRRQSFEEEGIGRQSFAEAVDAALNKAELSASCVFDRIKKVLGAESDAELAWIMGLSPQSVSNRKRRNAVPYREAVFISLWARVPLDFLLLGVGAEC